MQYAQLRVEKDMNEVKVRKKGEKILTAPPIQAGHVEIQADARTKVFGRPSSISFWKNRYPNARIVAHYATDKKGVVRRKQGEMPEAQPKASAQAA